jgi:hypothetical protein
MTVWGLEALFHLDLVARNHPLVRLLFTTTSYDNSPRPNYIGKTLMSRDCEGLLIQTTADNHEIEASQTKGDWTNVRHCVTLIGPGHLLEPPSKEISNILAFYPGFIYLSETGRSAFSRRMR